MANKQDSQSSLPEVVTEYLGEVIRRMRYRKKVRQEVRDELEGHFVDALKDIEEEGQREYAARKLIEQFGEAKVLAKLIRRGKKRCRPWWRKAMVRILQTVGVSMLLFILYTVWFMTGQPTVRVDYAKVWSDITRPAVVDEENAWLDYEKAIEKYVEADAAIEDLIKKNQKERKEWVRFGGLKAEDQEKILEWLRQHEEAWKNLTTEQQEVIQQCIGNDLVPFLNLETRKALPYYGNFDREIGCRVKGILYNKWVPLRTRERKPWVDSEKVPTDKLFEWKRDNRVPENFDEAVAVAMVRKWMKRTGQKEESVFEGFTKSEFESLQNWVRQNEAAWRDFKVGSLKRYCWREYGYGEDATEEERWLISVLLPHLGHLRNISRVGIWRARLAAERGEIDQALEDCLTVVRAGRHWRREKSSLIEQLVGLAIFRMGQGEIVRIVQREQIRAEQLELVQQQLKQVYEGGYPLMDIEGEKLFFLDAIQQMFTEGGPGGGHLIPRQLMLLTDMVGSAEEPIFVSSGLCIVHARRDATVAKALEIYGQIGRAIKLSPYQKREKEIDINDVINSLPRIRYFLLRYLVPAMGRAGDLAYRGKAEYEATLTVLALRRWELAKGVYPEELEELVVDGYCLEEDLPNDPYGAGLLRYEKRGEDFVLYSVGADFEDDGGVHNPRDIWGQDDVGGCDRVFWPVGE
ncbi:MAG: hypothetical protein JXD22_15045 [Sedimentisphaerales bacterium]|nr:hypothetical protein [Sedimentisphaerales bacterium]